MLTRIGLAPHVSALNSALKVHGGPLPALSFEPTVNVYSPPATSGMNDGESEFGEERVVRLRPGLPTSDQSSTSGSPQPDRAFAASLTVSPTKNWPGW